MWHLCTPSCSLCPPGHCPEPLSLHGGHSLSSYTTRGGHGWGHTGVTDGPTASHIRDITDPNTRRAPPAPPPLTPALLGGTEGAPQRGEPSKNGVTHPPEQQGKLSFWAGPARTQRLWDPKSLQRRGSPGVQGQRGGGVSAGTAGTGGRCRHRQLRPHERSWRLVTACHIRHQPLAASICSAAPLPPRQGRGHRQEPGPAPRSDTDAA